VAAVVPQAMAMEKGQQTLEMLREAKVPAVERPTRRVWEWRAVR
jgi:hypothetical protein